MSTYTSILAGSPRVTSSIPSLGHMPGFRARSPVGGAEEATTHWFLSLFLPPFPSLKVNKIKKIKIKQ